MQATTTIRRIILWSGQSLARNKLLSVTTVIGIALILFFTSILDGANFLSSAGIDEISGKIDLTLEITDGTKIDDPIVQQLKSSLENIGLTVEATSKEQALERFKQISPPDLVQFLDTYGINPLPASLLVKAETLEQYQQVENIVSKADFHGIVNLDANENGFVQQKNRIEKIAQITTAVSRAVIAIQALFWIIAVIIIVNTLQIVISHHREEISIMQLVGAPHTIIMGPFVIEGVFYALLGVILGTVGFMAAVRVVQAGIHEYLPQTPLSPLFNVFSTHYWSRLPMVIGYDLLVFALIGVIASLIALIYRVNILPERWLRRMPLPVAGSD